MVLVEKCRYRSPISKNHTANYGGCRVYREAKHVERVRAQQKLSYRGAVQVVKHEAIVGNANGQNTSVAHSNRSTPHSQPSQNSQTVYRTSNLAFTSHHKLKMLY